MKKIALLFVPLLAISACSTHQKVAFGELNAPKKAFNSNSNWLDEDYISSLQDFALDYSRALNKSENQIYSPISIATCYSMLFDGAKNSSQEELKSLLHYDNDFNHLSEIKNMLLRYAINDKDTNTYLDIAQSFWIDGSFADEIRKEYVDTLTNYYFAEAYQGDLQSDEAHSALADWINNKTKNFLNVKAKDFKGYGGVLWLLNTIYLKAQWANRFVGSNNTNDDFFNLDHSKTTATYMNRSTQSASFFKGDDFLVSSLELNKGLRFNILLPDEGSNYAQVLSDQTALSVLVHYQQHEQSSQTGRANITYSIPKFKFQNSYDLTEILKEMGVTTIFDSKKADLSGIAPIKPDENLYVSKSKHEAGIELNNDGIEAAAYTIIEVSKESAYYPEEKKIDFIVNRPFAYTVSTIEGTPLFMGFINNLPC